MGLCFSKWLELEIELVAPSLGGRGSQFLSRQFSPLHFILRVGRHICWEKEDPPVLHVLLPTPDSPISNLAFPPLVQNNTMEGEREIGVSPEKVSLLAAAQKQG